MNRKAGPDGFAVTHEVHLAGRIDEANCRLHRQASLCMAAHRRSRPGFVPECKKATHSGFLPSDSCIKFRSRNAASIEKPLASFVGEGILFGPPHLFEFRIEPQF